MPVYEYKALNKKGKKVKGIVTAEGPSAARLKLSQDMIFPVEIHEVKAEAKKASRQGFWSNLPAFKRIKPMEVTIAFRQLATLVSSGLPILDCLNTLIEQTEQAYLKRIFTQIREKVLEGSSL